MKKIHVIALVLAMAFASVSAVAQNGPTDPMEKGSTALSFGLGPGIPYYTSSGFGPGITFKFDYALFQGGPGTISFGGLFGLSYFGDHYNYAGTKYHYSTTNIGIAFRAAYHYGFDVPGLDCYAGFGIGPRFSIYNDANDYYESNSFEAGPLPMAFIGTSYYFNDVIGINGEFGYEFTYAQIGMTFKIK